MKYDDIINMPHHVSPTRPKMSMHDRAAQFAPFAALRGHKKAINSTNDINTEEYDIQNDLFEE